MIASRTCYNTLGKLFLCQVRHLIVRTTNLEGKDWLSILALQIDGILKMLYIQRDEYKENGSTSQHMHHQRDAETFTSNTAPYTYGTEILGMLQLRLDGCFIHSRIQNPT